jgi:signal transduction histidine kinase
VSDPDTVWGTVRRALVALAGVAGAAASVVVATDTTTRLDEASLVPAVAAYAVVGLLILSRHPAHPVGRLALVACVGWGLGEFLLAASYERLRTDPADRLAALGATLGSTGRAVGWLLVVLWLPLIFPDGRPAGPRRLVRPVRRIAIAALVLFVAVTLLSPGQSDLRLAATDNPIGLPHSVEPITSILAALALLLGVLTVCLAVVCLVYRWRHDTALVRQHVLWFSVAFLLPVCIFVLSVRDSAAPWMFGLASLPVPVVIAVATLQRRLYDVQLVLNRSITYGVLWLLIAGLYALTVAGVGAMLGQRGAPWIAWVAAGVVAASFAPLRDALQGAANRLTYGQWAQPATVLAATGRRLADAADVPALLTTVTAELGTGLGLSYVEISDVDGRLLAAHGSPAAELDSLPLTAYGVPVGVLPWSRRRLRDADRVLLSDLAGQVGSLVHAAGLVREVRAAQERLVLAREDERRRLRRDLHDGLGPALAGLALQVDTLRNRLGHSADEGLLTLRSGITATIADVRRIVEGLRPPALDELGLAGALTLLADRLARSGPVKVVVVETGLPRLPAAVEVAAYRIVQEALTNAVRHAGATTARVELALHHDGLCVRVQDDGTGVLRPRPEGNGLTTMRERAEEIGGSFDIRPEPGVGTTVSVRLPSGAEVSA